MMIRLLRPAFVVAAIFLSFGMGAAWAEYEIFVDNSGNNSVTVYSRTGGGNIAALRTISGAATGLNSPEGLAVDPVNKEIFVANDFPANGTVTVYDLTASGNVAPKRTIVGAGTGMDTPRGLVVDTVNDELIVVQVGTPAITVYDRTATGNATPKRTIAGATTGLNGPIGVSIDTVHNVIAVANITGNSITVYSRLANGDVAPTRTIAGVATGLHQPESVVIDPVSQELSVVNFGTPSITVYNLTDSGNVTPLRTISGVATGLNNPVGIALDAVTNELAVTNVNINTLTVYARTATGNIAPLRTIGGAATGLSFPAFLGLTTFNSTNLDVDASITASKFDALTDGLLIIRYMFGLTGPALANGALGGTVTRTDPAAIKAYLDSIRPTLDIDGNGTADGPTDGLLLLRYLFGLRGQALIFGAMGTGATRTTAQDIETYIQSVMP